MPLANGKGVELSRNIVSENLWQPFLAVRTLTNIFDRPSITGFPQSRRRRCESLLLSVWTTAWSIFCLQSTCKLIRIERKDPSFPCDRNFSKTSTLSFSFAYIKTQSARLLYKTRLENHCGCSIQSSISRRLLPTIHAKCIVRVLLLENLSIDEICVV